MADISKNLKDAAGQGKIYVRPIQRPLSVLPLKSEASSCSTSALKEKCVYIVIRSTLLVCYTLVSCHAYFLIICYQMTVMKAVPLSMTIASSKFILVQKMDSMLIIYS